MANNHENKSITNTVNSQENSPQILIIKITTNLNLQLKSSVYSYQYCFQYISAYIPN